MKHIEFCIPTAKKVVPSGPDWIHEVKYDGYRGRIERDGPVRLLSKSGIDWSCRYPWIIETVRKIRRHSSSSMARSSCSTSMASPISMTFTPTGTTTKSSCTPSTEWRSTATICADSRCTSARRPGAVAHGRAEGIFVAPYEQGEVGPDLFDAACRMGLEGLVSKHREGDTAAIGATLDQGQEPATSRDEPRRGPGPRSGVSASITFLLRGKRGWRKKARGLRGEMLDT